MWRDFTKKDKEEFNKLATHPLQSFEWGEFREKTGIKVIRKVFEENKKITQAFQLTIHPIPHTPWTIGYLPKGILPTTNLIEELKKIGKEKKCIFIQIEPNVEKNISIQANWKLKMENLELSNAAHPLFTKYTLQIDLTKSEEDLLKAMHPKARYNIKVAKKHEVKVEEENTDEGFNTFWKLTQETTTRQNFFAHTKNYHLTQWQTLPHKIKNDSLSSHLFIASYNKKPLTAWILFIFRDMLYYPYGASSSENRETMHSTLMMWEAILFGKKNKLKTFDLWGSAAPNAKKSDPWLGFTQFKEKFGPERIEFIGSYDLVVNKNIYLLYKIADKIRWALLKIKK
ncbi:MAG TPA: peptidoglycan bridge formation glycyltransferase FemA/FemB family protein [Patescibacteria group bacterium]